MQASYLASSMNINTKMLALYVKAFTHKPAVSFQKDATQSIILMPDISYERQITIEPKHCNAYNALTKWQLPLAALVHPNYMQTLSLPLQLEMMVNKDFPFSPMGMVQVANHITVNRLPSQSEKIHLRTHFGNVYVHKKGWLFEVITTAYSTSVLSSSIPQVKATSFYLARAKHTDTAQTKNLERKQAPDWITNTRKGAFCGVITKPLPGDFTQSRSNLNFASDIGRKYAKISGDYNPIHLYGVCAKLFGFKTAIAHGMFSKALLVSDLANSYRFYQGEFEINTVFKQAIALPKQTVLSSQLTQPNTLNFVLHRKLAGKHPCYLQGKICY
jgi:hypothetical protein